MQLKSLYLCLRPVQETLKSTLEQNTTNYHLLVVNQPIHHSKQIHPNKLKDITHPEICRCPLTSYANQMSKDLRCPEGTIGYDLNDLIRVRCKTGTSNIDKE